jgi:hypothetical protein
VSTTEVRTHKPNIKYFETISVCKIASKISSLPSRKKINIYMVKNIFLAGEKKNKKKIVFHKLRTRARTKKKFI